VLALDLDLTGDSWISLTVDDASPVARLYRAGEHQRVEVLREVILDVGDAGAVRLTIDGRPARPLGADDVRVRTRITRDNAADFLGPLDGALQP
jgi:hypothetical protein